MCMACCMQYVNASTPCNCLSFSISLPPIDQTVMTPGHKDLMRAGQSKHRLRPGIPISNRQLGQNVVVNITHLRGFRQIDLEKPASEMCITLQRFSNTEACESV